MNRKEKGSIELVTLALLAALIVVLAIPVVTGRGKPPVPGMSRSMHSGLNQTASVITAAEPTP